MTTERINEFIKESGYDYAEYKGKWRGFDVYEPIMESSEPVYIGLPLVVLVTGETLRFSTIEETFEYMHEMEPIDY